MSIKKFCKSVSDKISETKKESLGEYLNKSKFNLLGNSDFIIEGYITIKVYTDEEISFLTQDLEVSVLGRKLDMCYLKSNTARIKGYISEIRLNNKGR